MRIDKKISFKTGFGKSGDEYGHIQADGDIRNILTVFLLYFRDLNPNGFTDDHLGCTMNLTDYPIKIKYGQFGMQKEFLGFVFDGGGHRYVRISEGGYTYQEERKITSETRNGILKILRDVLGQDCIKTIWNNEKEYTSFSVVLNLPLNWIESKIDFEINTEKMVEKLNKFSKSLQAVTV